VNARDQPVGLIHGPGRFAGLLPIRSVRAASPATFVYDWQRVTEGRFKQAKNVTGRRREAPSRRQRNQHVTSKQVRTTFKRVSTKRHIALAPYFDSRVPGVRS